MPKKRPERGQKQAEGQANPQRVSDHKFYVSKTHLKLMDYILPALAALFLAIGGLFANYHHLWPALLMCASATLVFGTLFHFHYRHDFRGKQKVSRVTWVLGALAAALVASAIVLFFAPPKPERFGVSIKTLWQAVGRDNTQIFCEYNGRFLAPIPIVMFLRIVNRQEFAATIAMMRVEVRLRRRWLFIPGGWLPTTTVPEYMPLIWINPLPNDPVRLTLLGPRLDPRLKNPIEPHQTVEGWMLFDVPIGFSEASSPHVYRISLRDTEGHEFVALDQGPTEVGTVTTIGTPRGFEFDGSIDITGLQIRHLADPRSN